MRIDDKEEGQFTEAGKVEDENRHRGQLGDQEGPCGSQGEVEFKQHEKQEDRTLRGKASITSRIRTDIGLSSLGGSNLLSNIRLFDLPRIGLAESVLKPLVRPSLFDSQAVRLTNSFPSLVSGISQELARSVGALNLIPPSLTRGAFPRVSLGILDGLPSLFDQIIRPFPVLVHPKARLAKELGWVVHHTLPLALLDSANEDDLDEQIMAHYRENWYEVQKAIELDTDKSLVDLDSKEIMIQALQAHEGGLYRLVARSLLTEIERAIRVQLREKLVERGLNIKETILNEVDDLPSSAFHNLTSGIMQYDTVANHLYEHIDDENDRSQFEENPIPNRHAAVHGFVPYSSEKSSLNSIFITDFVFLMITQVKKERIQAAAQILKGYALSIESNEKGASSSK